MFQLGYGRALALGFVLACGAGLTACGPVEEEAASSGVQGAQAVQSEQPDELATSSAASCTYCYSCVCRASGGWMDKLCSCRCGSRSFNPYYASCTKLGTLIISKTKSCSICG